MTIVVTSKLASSAAKRRYLRAPTSVHFPEADQVPETGEHLRLRTALWSMLQLALADRAMLGSDQFLYWDPTDPTQCLAPDILVWFGASDRAFRTWKVWERGAPHLAIEIISETDSRDRPWARKVSAYRRSGVLELVRFDAKDAQRSLRLWDRVQGDLIEREISPHEPQKSDLLGLFWRVEPCPDLGRMLRLSRDSAGRERLLTEGEAYRAEAQAHRAEAEAHRVEAEAHRVEAEAHRAEAEARRVAEARIRELEAELARRSER